MAGRSSGIRVLFTKEMVEDVFEEWYRGFEWKIQQALMYAGEQFVTIARNTGNYTDRTGNLRSSIGYVVLKDGEILGEKFDAYNGKGEEGVREARKVAAEVAENHPKGFVLIGVAGMEYAAAVEAKNYDVITGAGVEIEQTLKQILSKIDFSS
ncbi:hypothetical protein [Joostella sp. CR20]|uniref:hypothetical protein n=1 Tax=Joostella sp. CR20 TaxID=2804312 RepID=UPI00313F0079